jgi:N-acetylmuramoyl-L-alanine amidase
MPVMQWYIRLRLRIFRLNIRRRAVVLIRLPAAQLGSHRRELARTRPVAVGAPQQSSLIEVRSRSLNSTRRGSTTSLSLSGGRFVVAVVPSAAPAQRGSLAGRTIVLDPGHNGGNAGALGAINRRVPIGNGKTKPCNTTGTATNSGYAEDAYTWDVALRARRVLRRRGATVAFTRDDDHSVGPCVDERARIADRAHADAMVSIHADGAPGSGFGFHVIEPALIRGLTDDIFVASHRLAVDLRSAFRRRTGEPYANYVAHNGLDRRSDLGGLRLAEVPAVFIETGTCATRATRRGWPARATGCASRAGSSTASSGSSRAERRACRRTASAGGLPRGVLDVNVGCDPARDRREVARAGRVIAGGRRDRHALDRHHAHLASSQASPLPGVTPGPQPPLNCAGLPVLPRPHRCSATTWFMSPRTSAPSLVQAIPAAKRAWSMSGQLVCPNAVYPARSRRASMTVRRWPAARTCGRGGGGARSRRRP